MGNKPRISYRSTLIRYSPYDEGYEMRWVCAGNNGLGLAYAGRTPQEAYSQWHRKELAAHGTNRWAPPYPDAAKDPFNSLMGRS